MGNRAHVIYPEARVAIYLHWNGGLESMVAFLDYANERKLGSDCYGAIRFCQLVTNFFGGTLSCGVQGVGAGPISALLRDYSEGVDPAYAVERDRDGTLFVGKMARNGKLIEPVALEGMIERARLHPYNVKGGLLADIRERNKATEAEPAMS